MITPPAAPPAQTITNGLAGIEHMLLSPTKLFLTGKKAGSMNVVLQGADGRCVVKDVIVTIDPDTLQDKLTELMPIFYEVQRTSYFKTCCVNNMQFYILKSFCKL